MEIHAKTIHQSRCLRTYAMALVVWQWMSVTPCMAADILARVRDGSLRKQLQENKALDETDILSLSESAKTTAIDATTRRSCLDLVFANLLVLRCGNGANINATLYRNIEGIVFTKQVHSEVRASAASILCVFGRGSNGDVSQEDAARIWDVIHEMDNSSKGIVLEALLYLDWDKHSEIIDRNILKLYESFADNEEMRRAVFETVDGVLEFGQYPPALANENKALGQSFGRCDFQHAMSLYETFVRTNSFRSDDTLLIIRSARLYHNRAERYGVTKDESQDVPKP